MCTASWLHDRSGYWLFFNRDELRDRQPALLPAIRAIRGVRYVAPVDGDHGGTWLAVNEFGITLCLLNLYGVATESTEAATSRGLLMNNLVDSCSRDEITARLRDADLRRFNPFSILALAPGEPAAIVVWDGRTLARCDAGDDRVPYVSSSYRVSEVTAARVATFDKLARLAGGVSPEVLAEFHASHAPERGPFSPCMHRDDASTVSATVVRVDHSEAVLEYRDGAPCESGTSTRHALPLVLAREAAT
jgi:hypothetical protein